MSVLVLCPKKLTNNWNTYKDNYVNNPIAADRLRYDVLYHTDLNRTHGTSNGLDLDRLNWGNFDLVVIDESHNFRNGGKLVENPDEDTKDNRYVTLMKKVIRAGVKTKVLMISATPVNNRFNDLKNQLALAYEGHTDYIDEKLNTTRSIDEIFKNAQRAFNTWSKWEPCDRTTENLLKMLGTSKEELLSETKDLYVNFIHPNDREIYSEFINNLKSKEQTLSLQYRLVKKNGEIFRVKDSMTSKKLNENILVGYSVLTDITDIKNNGDDIDFLAEKIPCGFLKFTCEKRPKIIYINKQMINILNIPETKDGELDYLELYKDDMFLMIPMEERRRFSLYLNQIQSSDSPTSGEITLLRCDGTKAYVFGWVTKHINDKGKEEFHAFCFDVTEKRIEKKEQETKCGNKATA